MELTVAGAVISPVADAHSHVFRTFLDFAAVLARACAPLGEEAKRTARVMGSMSFNLETPGPRILRNTC